MSRPFRYVTPLLVLSLVAFWAGPVRALPDRQAGNEEPIRVVTTLPLLKEFVEQVGGTHVAVTSLITGGESEHTYTPKPGDLTAISQARLLVQVGVGLEGWVTPMIEAAKNPRLTVVTTAQGIPLLREQEPVEQNGEHPPHAFGNPHVWLDPENAKTMIRTMTDTLIRVAPAHRADFLINQARYVNEITTVETDIQAQVKPLRDRRIVTHHAAWPYFARRFGFQIEGVIIEPPGGEVSAKNLAALTTLIRQKKIRVIATEPQLNTAVAQTLAQETGARLVTITRLPGALPGTETYLLMLRYDAEQLIRALRAP